DHFPGAVALEFFQVLEQLVAVAPGELNVEKDEGRPRLVRAHHVEQAVAAGEADHLMALQAEQGRDQLQVVRLVLHYHDRGHQCPRSTGRVNQNVLPRPTALSTPMVPPCCSTRRRDTASPRPVPS